MDKLLRKVIGKIRQLTRKSHNMYLHPAEQYYFDVYWSYIAPYLQSPSYILEIGCQHGRFTIPMARIGHRIEATDINSKYFSSVRKKLGNNRQVNFHEETIRQSLISQSVEQFDCVMCIELLYILPDYRELMSSFGEKMKKGSLFIGSHRTLGYYTYRLLGEQKIDEAVKIIDGKHPQFNATDEEQLRKQYEALGFKILLMKPIGIFSGLLKDPFTRVADPGKMGTMEREKLKKLETDPQLQSLFFNNARYILIIAEKL